MHTNKRAGRRLRGLIVEDGPADAERVVRGWRQAGFDPRVERVETKVDHLARPDRSPDQIRSDFRPPRFSAPEALALRQASTPRVRGVVHQKPTEEAQEVRMICTGNRWCDRLCTIT